MENKFTDDEIMKALECCKSQECGECSRLCNDFPDSHECKVDLMEKVYSLINCQKAEIERLNVELVGMRGACESYKIHYDNAKAEIAELQRRLQEGIDLSDTVLKIVKSEARKEFAELIKQSTTDKSIDELLEEMEGEDGLN